MRREIAKLTKNFSPSYFLAFRECPRAFYYKYIAKIQLPQKKIHLVFGEAIHNAIQEMIAGKSLHDAKTMLIEDFSEDKLLPEEIDDRPAMLQTGAKILDLFENNLSYLDAKYQLKGGVSEQWIEAVLKDPYSDEVLPLVTKGKIDHFTNSENIIEFKTSGSKWNENDVKFKWQTIFYNWMYYQNKGRHPNKIVYLVLTKQKTPQLQELEVHYTEEDHAKLFQDCKSIINRIELGQFNGKPDEYHQPYCDCYKFEKALTI